MSPIQRLIRSYWQPKYWLIAFLSILLIGVLLFATLQPIKVLPRIRLAPGFSFIDHHAHGIPNNLVTISFDPEPAPDFELTADLNYFMR